MTQNPLHDIATWLDRAGPSGIPSICSAHPMVLEASMRATLPTQLPLLIEATCNQVNQDGGYTGMTPKDFRSFVEQIAAENGFPTERIILAGDHLGPNPWKSLPAEDGDGEGRSDDQRLRSRGIHQAAPRLLHGLPGRAGSAEGRGDRFPRRAT